MSHESLIAELTRAKALFQARAICAAMGIPPGVASLNQSNSTPLEVQCNICGDYHESDAVPYACQTGDSQ